MRRRRDRERIAEMGPDERGQTHPEQHEDDGHPSDRTRQIAGYCGLTFSGTVSRFPSGIVV